MKTGTSSLMDGKDYKQNNSQRFDEFMDLVKSSQQEISDEEIEKAVHQNINYGGGSEGWIKDAFKKGAKWYREQLKTKL